MKLKLLFISVILSVSAGFSQGEMRKDSIVASFGYNQSEVLNAESLIAQLNKIDVGSLSYIQLIGYTDSTGSLSRNKSLAADRMKSVEAILKSTKLKQITTEHLNANELSGFRSTPDDLNRRVDLLFYVKKTPPSLVFELNKPVNLNINFVGGKAEFLSTSYPNLEKLRDILLEDTTLQVKLYGHVCCDNDMPLSIKRATAVMQYLIHSDIDEKRMISQGFSNSKPLAPDNSETNMSGNRRVEAVFYRKE